VKNGAAAKNNDICCHVLLKRGYQPYYLPGQGNVLAGNQSIHKHGNQLGWII
jgi:hypothetical protein